MRISTQTLTATYRIVTPMFIGDADQKATGINPGSVKGALRFWWRALNWGCIALQDPNEAAALKRLHREEAALFGSAAENGPGQARFLMKVVAPDVHKAALERDRHGCGIHYLAGQGLYHFRNGFLREALAPSRFDLICRLRPGTDEAARNQLIDAMLALGTLGGLGSRARKGFGSLAIQALRDGDQAVAIPTDTAALIKRIAGWKQTPGLPPFTAFSANTRIDISLQGPSPMGLLDTAGQELQLYRSWGQRGKVCGQDSERRFKSDHDLMEGITQGDRPRGMPERSVFGLPHNYFFSSTKAKVDFTVGEKERGRSRRASPLFIHVHQFPDDKALLLHLLLPARFLTPGDQLEFKPGRGRPKYIKFQDQMIDWGKIHDYMDRFAGWEKAL